MTLARRAANSSGGKISVPVNTGCGRPVVHPSPAQRTIAREAEALHFMRGL